MGIVCDFHNSFCLINLVNHLKLLNEYCNNCILIKPKFAKPVSFNPEIFIM